MSMDEFVGSSWILKLNEYSKKAGKNLFNLTIRLSSGKAPGDV
jgi:hypothetical protein